MHPLRSRLSALLLALVACAGCYRSHPLSAGIDGGRAGDDEGPFGCAVDNGGCHPDAVCSAAHGTVICTCRPGFVGDGERCDPAPDLPRAAFLKATAPGPVDVFGVEVALSADGDTLLVGAWLEDEGDVLDAGAGYVFRWAGTRWAAPLRLTAPMPRRSGNFGGAVTVDADGTTLGLGEPAVGDPRPTGRAYALRAFGETFEPDGTFVAAEEDEPRVGVALAISSDGQTLVVGNDGTRASVYRRRGDGRWRLDQTLAPPDGGPTNGFGSDVAISGDATTVAVGSPLENGSATGVDGAMDAGAPGSGAVFVYRRDDLGAFELEAYVKASNTGAQDAFGDALALSATGDVLAVGAWREDGSGTEVDPPSDEAAFDAGAAYVYRRGSTGWAFEAYVKSPTTFVSDGFGLALDLDGPGRRLAVGALRGGVAPGAGGGATFVYQRSEPGWALLQTFVGPSPGSDDAFGRAVSLSANGRVLAVGASMEGSSGGGVDPPMDDGAPASGAAFVFDLPP